MTQTLARYHARSPRYILQSQDNTLVRVAGANQVPWEEGTEIKNISLSGISFTAPTDLCPVIGEVIKIQFVVPGGESMAVLALVTRLEPLGRLQMLVGIKFTKMNPAHRQILISNLTQKMREQQRQQVLSNTKKWGWYAALIPALTLGLWIFLTWLQFHMSLILNLF
jgi:hypothetical protein